MRLKLAVCTVGLAAVGGLVVGAPTFAEGAVSPTSADGALTTVTVRWDGLPANETVIAMQCAKTNKDVTFNQAADCSQATYQNYVAGPEGSGSGEFVLFGGDEPNGENWGCGPLSTVPNRQDVCYVRLTTGTITNTVYNEFFSVDFVPQTASSGNGLRVGILASGVIVLLGAGYFTYRKTRARAVN